MIKKISRQSTHQMNSRNIPWFANPWFANPGSVKSGSVKPGSVKPGSATSRSGHPVLQRERGFTLVEIAIVMVVIGLLLGGIMKGQELIDTARTRSLVSDVTGIRSAWYSFQDRYRSLPGDFPNARTQLDDDAVPGNGNGKIDDGQERASVWQQLALAGYINGNFDGLQASTGTANDIVCADNTCPRNPYNGYYKISFGTQAVSATDPANEFFTGGQIPVGVLAQVDRQLDDGIADSGRFRVHKDFAGSCANGGEWNLGAGHVNCAGVLRE